jgi:hypothetical protein
MLVPMGRLAQSYAGLQIQDMYPYTAKTQLTLTASSASTQFPNADWLNTQDKPFAVHRMIPRILALTDGVIAATQPDIEIREALVLLSLLVQGFNQPATKDMTAIEVGNLLGGTTSERYWRFDEPLVFPNSYGMIAAAQTIAFPAGVAYNSLRITLTLQGHLLQVTTPNG